MNKIIKTMVKTVMKAFLVLFILTFNITLIHSQDLQKVIPASSSGVLTLDGEYFLSKIDLAQILRLEMFQEMDEHTQGRKGKKYNEYSKIYKAPESIGLKINSKWYLFTHNSGDTTKWGMPVNFTVIAAPLLNNKKFENFIKKVSDSSIVKNGNYKYTVTGYNQIVAWNKQQVLFLINSSWERDNKQQLLKELNYLSKLKEGETIKNNSNFNLAQSQKFDFNYWMNYNSLFSGLGFFRYMRLTPGMSSLPGMSEDFYKESYLHLNLNFNKGAVSFNAKQFMNPAAVKQTEFLYGQGINPELLKYFHKDHFLGTLSFSSNMKGIKSVLDTAFNDSTKEEMNKEFIKILYEKRAKNNPEIKAINAQLDSMYNDLYSSRYSNYMTDTVAAVPYDDYTVDTAAVSYDYYGDIEYDTLSTDEEPAPTDEPIYYDNTVVDSVAVADYDSYDYTTDTTELYEPSYRYDATSDSIYEAKNSRINALNDKKKAILDEYYKNKAKELGTRHTDFLEFFEGDFIIACTDYRFVQKKYKTYEYDEEEYKTKEVEKTREQASPYVVALMTLNKVDKAHAFLKKLERDTFLTKQDNYYYIKYEEQKIFVAISDKILIITNDESLVSKNSNGFDPKDQISDEIKNILLNKQVSAYVNIKDIYARMNYENLSPTKHAQYTLLMNSFIDSHATGESFKNNISNSQLQINFTNKLDNSFYEILRIINESYKISKNR